MGHFETNLLNVCRSIGAELKLTQTRISHRPGYRWKHQDSEFSVYMESRVGFEVLTYEDSLIG